jgi:hypothetical protein
MQSRIAPTHHDRMTHQNIVHWFNDLMYDIKVFTEAGHLALISPARLHSWDRYRTELLECDHLGPDSDCRFGKHQHAVNLIDSLIYDLAAIWDKASDKAISPVRLEELDALYNGLQECKTPTHFY